MTTSERTVPGKAPDRRQTVAGTVSHLDSPRIVGIPDNPPTLSRPAAQALLAIVLARVVRPRGDGERDNPRDVA
ncbi:MAG: hypothetical protein ACHQNA_12685 [Acidimicrobiales bacterium]